MNMRKDRDELARELELLCSKADIDWPFTIDQIKDNEYLIEYIMLWMPDIIEGLKL